MKKIDQFSHLPGGALVKQGLNDLREGRSTTPALLLEIARGRLALVGLLPEREAPSPVAAELQLYRQLRSEGGDAYSRYNALLRELNSFIRAFEQATRTSTGQL